MIRWRNLLSHDVNVLSRDGSVLLSLPAEGRPARLTEVADDVETVQVDGVEVPTKAVRHGDVMNLPPSTPGQRYVVSRLVAMARPDREDLYFPYPEIRGTTGSVIGCGGLARFAGDAR